MPRKDSDREQAIEPTKGEFAMRNHILKSAAGFLISLVAMLYVAPALADQSCTSYTTLIYAQVSVTKQSFLSSNDGYVTNYYTGWNGNCWSPAQDAFVFAVLGNGPFTYSISIFDPDNWGIKFTDSNGTGCVNNTAPSGGNVVVFGQITNKGRVGPLYPWPIPGLTPPEQGEYSGFALTPDQMHLTFIDRDNAGPDYHFGIYLCDPRANTTNGVRVFLSDPGQQPKGN